MSFYKETIMHHPLIYKLLEWGRGHSFNTCNEVFYVSFRKNPLTKETPFLFSFISPITGIDRHTGFPSFSGKGFSPSASSGGPF